MAVATRSPQPIKALIALRGLRQDRLARDAGVSEHWLSRCINGYSKPSAELVERLAALLEVPATDLFVEDPEAVVVSFVERTTTSSGVPTRLNDEAAAEKVAALLRDAQ